MTKISSKTAYPKKKPIVDDYFVGTDSENFGKTVNFGFEETAGLINKLNGTPILNYVFSTSPYVDTEVLLEGRFLSDENELGTPLLTKLHVNKFNNSGDNLQELYLFLQANATDFYLKLRNSNNQNNAVYFDIASIEDFPDYFILNITVFKENEFLPLLENLNVYFFDFELKATSAGTSDPLKLDKDGYTGTAKDIDDRILVLENLQDLNTNFTGQAFAVWTGVGYVYDVIYPDYYIQGVLYPGATQQITLNASDATYPRFDVIYVNALGAQKATGIPALNPLIPTIDEGIELFVTSELVTALSTTPVDSSIEQVYNENTEWTTSSLGGLVNFNATNRPSKGVKNADIVNPSSGMFTQFVSSTTKSISGFNTLKFDLFFVENYGKTHGINVYFLNGSNTIGSYVIKTGLNNYKFGSFGSYQSLVVDFSSFTFTGVSFDTIKIVFPWANAGFSIDNVVLVKGSSVVSPTQKAITSIVTDSGIANATIKDDTFTLKGGNGAVVSAVGKEITITPANQTKTQVGLGNVDNTSDINKPISTAQQAALDLKVDKVAGKGLSTEDYTPSEKNKLASIDATHYLAPLQTTVQLSALPQAGISDKARVYVENDLSDYFYDATASSGDIAPDDQVGGIGFWRKVAVGGETAASIKTKYESNADTNAFTNALKSKLDSITEIFTTALKTNYDAAYTWVSTNGAAVLAHISSAHAPSNAQKNSDITKAEIEAKLTGEITTHTHPAVGGGGDMVLASAQTVSGLKTFLSGMFGLRNVANTFTSSFTNANTAARTYTLQNRDGILADNTDLAGKMANPIGGVASYLPKFLTANTMGLSRLWDTGTFFGIGTVSAPLKDISLGNQLDREIGIEVSDSVTKGRNLRVAAGKAINYLITATLQATGNVNNWQNMWYDSSGNIYGVTYNSLYKQTGGTGSFVLYTTTGVPTNKRGGCTAYNGDVYICVESGDIWKQTGGTGSFVALGQTSRSWYSMAAMPNGDIYATLGIPGSSPFGGTGGDVYKQTGGTGNFVAMGFTSRPYTLCSSSTGDLFLAHYGGSIYKMAFGTSTLVDLLQTSRNWTGISTDGTDVFACTSSEVYKQTNNTGNFLAMSQPVGGNTLTYNSKKLYTAVYSGDIYFVGLDSLGAANLDGGTYQAIAGTGKGTGKSRYEVWTGQKTISGTDMQVETLREYVDENGYHIYVSIPSYANDAAADADTNLPSGASYKLTGNRTIFHKP